MGKAVSSIVRYLKFTDRVLILSAFLATAYGFVLVYSAKGGGRTALIQGIGIAIGLSVMIVLSKADYHSIARYWKIIAVVCLLLFALTLVIGKSRAGSQDRSWIWIGPVTIQPAEFIKVAFVITLSAHFDLVKEDVNSPLNILLLGAHALIPIALLVLQRDIGMTLIFLLMFFVMMFMANVKLRYFLLAMVLTFIGSPFIWGKVLKTTQKNRILALIFPAQYPQQAYQQLQGRRAIGAGEIFGYGLFHGPITQGPAYLLPEKQNDMIFAVAGEELGLIGCLLIFLIVSVLLMRIIRDAQQSKDRLGAMICIGVFASFATQMLINIGAALMLFPITGISLPFFSSGGSSIVSCYLGIGFVLSVYTHRNNLLFAGKEYS